MRTAMRLSTDQPCARHPTWWLYGGNHTLMAWAGTSLACTADATRAAEAFQVGAATARLPEVYHGPGRTWCSQAWLGEDVVATSTSGFTTEQNARRAAHDVRDDVSRASRALLA